MEFELPTCLKKFIELVDEHDAVCDADCPAHIYAANSKLHMVEKWEEIINVFDFHFPQRPREVLISRRLRMRPSPNSLRLLLRRLLPRRQRLLESRRLTTLRRLLDALWSRRVARRLRTRT